MLLALQVGKSFRNEIAPRQGLTRQREFTQASERILALNEFEKRAYDKGPVPLPEEIPTLHRSDFQTLHRTAEPVIEGFFFIFERLEWQFSGRNWMVCEADSQADEEVRGLATEISCAMQQLLVTWSLD